MENVILSSYSPEELGRIFLEVYNELSRKTSNSTESTEYYSAKNIKDKYKVALSTITKWQNDGLLKAYRIGSKCIRYKRSDVENLITEL